MVAQFNNTSREITARLIEGLKLIPMNWSLTPVLGNKNPYRVDWNYATPMSRRQIIVAIEDGDIIIGKKGERRKCYPQGYGLRTGKWSSGILAIDADGNAAHEKLNQLGGLPKTVSFTSGKPGRCQYLVQVPEEYWSVIETKKINTGVKGEDGKDQLLEFRWNGCQSVLPPSVHPETGSYKWINSPQDCEVAQCPTWIIEYFLNESTQATTTTPFTNDVAITGDVPLYQCLTKDDRDLIDRGVGEGSRDDNGAKLARNLIGTAARLNHLGYRFEGDARQLFDDYCARCSPPLSAKDADRIWKSAEKSNPSASLTDDALLNCIKAWQRNQTVKPQQPEITKPNNVIPHPTVTKQYLSGDELLKEIDLLINANIGRSQLEASLFDLAAKAGRRTNDILRLYKSREREDEENLERETATRQLPTLLEAQRAKLSPSQLLWGDGGKLAYLIESIAENMPVSPEALLTTLFPVAGSRIGTSSRLVINPHTNYTATSIFWTCVVSKTGTLKSPAQKQIIDPLNELEAQEYERWKVALDNYKRELKRCGRGDELPEEPTPRQRFIVQGCSTEARMKIHGENPRGLLYHRDEWMGFSTGRNKYRAGKGDDAQLDLSEFNGDALYKDVIDNEKCVYLKKSAISRTGNTQPEILKQFQSEGDFADHAGEFARWLYCLKENPLAFMDLFKEDDGIGKLFNSELSFLYRLLGQLPERDYFFNDDAKRIYQRYQHQLMKWLAVEEHPGLAATYPKLQTYLGRFALWLHLVNAVLAGESTPVQFINERTMKAACECVDFYLAQARLLYALNSDQQAIAGNLLKIKAYIEKHPLGVTLRDIRCGIRSLRKVPTSEVEQDCKTLLSSGLIKQVSKTYYPNFSKNDDSDDKGMTPCHHTQTLTESKLQTSDDIDDKFFSKSEIENSLDVHLKEPAKIDFIETSVIICHQKTEPQSEQELEGDDTPTSNGHQSVITVIENTGTETSNANHDSCTEVQKPAFSVGDTVAAADPYEMKYSWRGEVKEISADGAEVLVYWAEREGKPGTPCEKHEASYLRLVKSHE
ncbi:MAG TPA: DUF3987 domain-containing protein [Trichormus sp. M33_DOE_039]|nr:DUF3987 domain-containing protein [Trichormus sp. M33_DOE_039]